MVAVENLTADSSCKVKTRSRRALQENVMSPVLWYALLLWNTVCHRVESWAVLPAVSTCLAGYEKTSHCHCQQIKDVAAITLFIPHSRTILSRLDYDFRLGTWVWLIVLRRSLLRKLFQNQSLMKGGNKGSHICLEVTIHTIAKSRWIDGETLQ